MLLMPPPVPPAPMPLPERHPTTVLMLNKDRAKAADILLQLRYQLSRSTSTIEVK